MKTRLLLCLLITAGVLSVRAESFELDPAHSAVQFEIRHLFSTVPGRFNDFTGTINFNREAPETSSVEATIQATSIDTANEKRDTHLRSPDFFEVDKYPTITFKSTKVEKTDDQSGKVVGDLTMHGVTKPVTLEVKFLGMGKGMQGETRAGFTGTTTIDRKEFGLTWGKMVEGTAILGDEVTITVNVEAVVK